MSQLDRWHKLGDVYVNESVLKRLLKKHMGVPADRLKIK